jgi:iron(III) transport system substrate-binding protein
MVFVMPLQAATELLVYSERKPPLIEPILAAYTEQTGVKVRVLSDQAAVLIERLAAEGSQTRADLLLTVDAGNLWQAAERGLLAEVQSAKLEAAVPQHLRDPQNRWFALTRRARTLVYNPALIKPEQLSTYEALAAPEFKGKLCLRSSRKVYNQSLTAMLIERLGAQQTEAVLKGWVANLAAPPFADDTLVIQAVEAGQCAVGLVNTYYFGRFQKDQPQLKSRLFWANQGAAGGVHVNVSGAALTTHGKQPQQARALLEWLAGEQAQTMFATLDFEYPVRAHTALAAEVAGWGEFVEDQHNLVNAGQRQAEAVKLMDRAGWR